jgi:hypothetical protein
VGWFAVSLCPAVEFRAAAGGLIERRDGLFGLEQPAMGPVIVLTIVLNVAAQLGVWWITDQAWAGGRIRARLFQATGMFVGLTRCSSRLRCFGSMAGDAVRPRAVSSAANIEVADCCDIPSAAVTWRGLSPPRKLRSRARWIATGKAGSRLRNAPSGSRMATFARNDSVTIFRKPKWEISLKLCLGPTPLPKTCHSKGNEPV